MLDPQPLVEEAERLLAAALGPGASGREPEPRRDALVRAALVARSAYDVVIERAIPNPSLEARALLALARASAASAELARHGAGQLSLSAQRAPTVEDCALGWQRVAAIVDEARAFAAASMDAARRIAPASVGAARDGNKAAARAAQAVLAAEEIVRGRNDAFTFHSDDAFSFGEGWHVSAAAVLTGVSLQIEADQRATPHVERFLREAGLHGQIVSPRPRPRAQRQSTGLVAQAIARDPAGAQQRLREAWLGRFAIADEVRAFVRARVGLDADRAPPSVALWVRNGAHQPERNTEARELEMLVRCAIERGLRPMLLGEAPPEGFATAGAIDVTLHRLEPVFRGDDGRRAQLQMFELLRREHALVAQLGVTSAAMDGPALLGLPTAYVTAAPNPRMRQWVGVVAGYEELVRAGDPADFERDVRALFARWQRLSREDERAIGETGARS